MSMSMLDGKVGRIYMPRQDFESLALRKMKVRHRNSSVGTAGSAKGQRAVPHSRRVTASAMMHPPVCCSIAWSVRTLIMPCWTLGRKDAIDVCYHTPPQGLKRERQEAAQGGGDGDAAAADDAVDMTDI